MTWLRRWHGTQGRRRCLALLAGVALLLPSCGWDGNFTVLGYTTRPNYDLGIKTVRVPIFENNTFIRGLEFDLTRAVIREIEAKTPYKVVGLGCTADTELSGRIITFNKSILNRTQLNEVREAETVLGVEIVWRDLRSGEVLSGPKPKPDEPPPPPGAKPKPFLVQSTAGFIEELGESLATAEKRNVDRLAVKIREVMEKSW